LVAVVGERGEADGFQVLGVGHWAPPVFEQRLMEMFEEVARELQMQILDRLIVCIV
jgi:vacuolar-type H+-ATPase subunit F/Vma7